jgi:hypothetical protein
MNIPAMIQTAWALFRKALQKCKNAYWWLYRAVSFGCHPGITAGRVRWRGLPVIQVCAGARLEIGDGVLLNSSNYRYHLNL